MAPLSGSEIKILLLEWLSHFLIFFLGWIQEALRPFPAELPKSDSDTRWPGLGQFESDFGGPSGCNSDRLSDCNSDFAL